MKLLAQSLVPTEVSYLHLAYVAASENTGHAISATSVLITGAVLAYVVQKKRLVWKLAAGGFFIIAMAVVFTYPFPVRYTHPEGVTSIRASGLCHRIHEHQSQGDEIPSSVREMKRLWQLEDEEIIDAWGHELRIAKTRMSGKLCYQVISSSVDGKFGTKDDIVYPRETDTETDIP